MPGGRVAGLLRPVKGPASVPPDYRILDILGAIQL